MCHRRWHYLDTINIQNRNSTRREESALICQIFGIWSSRLDPQTLIKSDFTHHKYTNRCPNFFPCRTNLNFANFCYNYRPASTNKKYTKSCPRPSLWYFCLVMISTLNHSKDICLEQKAQWNIFFFNKFRQAGDCLFLRYKCIFLRYLKRSSLYLCFSTHNRQIMIAKRNFVIISMCLKSMNLFSVFLYTLGRSKLSKTTLRIGLHHEIWQVTTIMDVVQSRLMYKKLLVSRLWHAVFDE